MLWARAVEPAGPARWCAAVEEFLEMRDCRLAFERCVADSFERRCDSRSVLLIMCCEERTDPLLACFLSDFSVPVFGDSTCPAFGFYTVAMSKAGTICCEGDSGPDLA